ncbi:MAG: hypothetical protein H8D34_16695 [Chloroflexi bacterium]|nr:hypothetical protein [Chloroflexota bacterium]MBL7161516.1 hypothetical protein [Anaerolineales bacterium]
MSKRKQLLYMFAILLIGGFLSTLLYAIAPIITEKLGSEVAWSAIGLCLSLYAGLVLLISEYISNQENLKGKFEQYVLRPWSYKIYLSSDHDSDPEILDFPGLGGIKKKLPWRKSKRGRRSLHGTEVERRTVLKWEALDPSISPITLEEFLVQEFGTSGGGIPNVSTSSFYDWRKKFLKDF